MEATVFTDMVTMLVNVAEDYGIIGADLDVLDMILWENMGYLITNDDRKYD